MCIVCNANMSLFNTNKPHQNNKMCNFCGGKGWHYAMGERPCSHCVGTGRDIQSDLWAFPCNYCNGRGRESYCERQTCSSCGGSGYSRY